MNNKKFKKLERLKNKLKKLENLKEKFLSRKLLTLKEFEYFKLFIKKFKYRNYFNEKDLIKKISFFKKVKNYLNLFYIKFLFKFMSYKFYCKIKKNENSK